MGLGFRVLSQKFVCFSAAVGFEWAGDAQRRHAQCDGRRESQRFTDPTSPPILITILVVLLVGS